MAVLCGTASVLLAVAVIRVWDRRQPGQGRAARAGHALDGKVQPMVFLFRAARLVDNSDTFPARSMRRVRSTVSLGRLLLRG